MAETFQWSQTSGASPGDIADIGETGNLFNFKDYDNKDPGNYDDYPITASDSADEGRSYEVWLRMHFTDTFNVIDNLQFWMSTDFSPNTGLTVYWKGDTVGAYATPVKIDSTKAVSTVPSADPATANVTIGGSLTGELTAAGYSDYILLQLDIATTAASGDTSLAIYTGQYDVQ